MKEIFKAIQKYDNLYEVSTIGRVRNCKNGHILNQSFTLKGYPSVSMWVNQKVHSKAVHRLMLLAFGEPKYHLMHVNHINGIRSDNRLENLEWVSNRENASHSIVRQSKRTSNYPGVCFSKAHGRYVAQVYYNKKNHYLGLYDSEIVAHGVVLDFHQKNNIINRYI